MSALGVPAAPAPLTDAQILELARQQGDEAEHGFIFNKDGRWSVLTFARALLALGVSGGQHQTFCAEPLMKDDPT